MGGVLSPKFAIPADEEIIYILKASDGLAPAVGHWTRNEHQGRMQEFRKEGGHVPPVPPGSASEHLYS